MEGVIYLFGSVVPTNRKTRLTLFRTVPKCQRVEGAEKKDARFVRDPTLEDVAHDGTTRIVWITQMEPIRHANGPTLVVHLVHKGAIFCRDAKGGDAGHAVRIRRGVHGTGGTGASTDGGKVGGRGVGGAGGGRGGGECLVESLADHFRRVCVGVCR